MTLLCPANVSEGRDPAVLAALAEAAGPDLLDLHADPHHHRSVLTLVGPAAARRLAATAVELVDLRRHRGVHPRIGALDVVPFVPWDGATLQDAVEARDRTAAWIGAELGVPAFLYGEGAPTLPEVRRRAFVDLDPSCGPRRPHATAGAVAVGARDPLVAYNVWLARPDPALARRVAAAVRSPAVRALGLVVGERVQVSMNLVAPGTVGPAAAYDAVAALAPVAGAELVGLVPAAVLTAVPPERWGELDLAEDRTVEARLARRAGGARSESS
jgi:glutamate formiminotransferase